jgi:hypothetical protein
VAIDQQHITRITVLPPAEEHGIGGTAGGGRKVVTSGGNALELQPVRMTAALLDGTHIVGVPLDPHVSVHTVFANVKVPPDRVRAIQFADDRKTATFGFWNGDKLVGSQDLAPFRLSSALGEVKIPSTKLRHVQMSLGGADLRQVDPKAATGNKWFMASLRNARPQKILGRTYPASDFIQAHAGGRIEYEFETPVREFRATLTMYDSYGGTKGNVIFKIETEEGTVYTSRPIRNSQEADVYVRFKPSRKLVLITDENGSPDEDWSVWLHPEVR